MAAAAESGEAVKRAIFKLCVLPADARNKLIICRVVQLQERPNARHQHYHRQAEHACTR
jgi:hypothetical protein